MSMLLQIADSQQSTNNSKLHGSQANNGAMSKTNSQQSSQYQDSSKYESQSNKSSGSNSTMQSRLDQNYNNEIGQNKRLSANYHKSKKGYYNTGNNQHRHTNYQKNNSYGHHKSDKYQHQNNGSTTSQCSNADYDHDNNSNSGKQHYNQHGHKYYNNNFKNGSDRPYYNNQSHYNHNNYNQYKQRQFGNQLNGQNTSQNYQIQSFNQQLYPYSEVHTDFNNVANSTYVESDQTNFLGPCLLQNVENELASMAVSQSSPSLDWINEQNRMQSKEIGSDQQSAQFAIKSVHQSQLSSQQNADQIRTNEMESNNSCSGATTSVSSASQQANQDLLFAFKNFTVDIQSQYEEDSMQGATASQRQVILCQGSIQVPSSNIEVIIRKGDLIDIVIGQIMHIANFSPDLKADMKITLQLHFQRQMDLATQQLMLNDQTPQMSETLAQNVERPQQSEVDLLQNAAKVFDSASQPFYPCQDKLEEFDQNLQHQQ